MNFVHLTIHPRTGIYIFHSIPRTIISGDNKFFNNEPVIRTISLIFNYIFELSNLLEHVNIGHININLSDVDVFNRTGQCPFTTNDQNLTLNRSIYSHDHKDWNKINYFITNNCKANYWNIPYTNFPQQNMGIRLHIDKKLYIPSILFDVDTCRFIVKFEFDQPCLCIRCYNYDDVENNPQSTVYKVLSKINNSFQEADINYSTSIDKLFKDHTTELKYSVVWKCDETINNIEYHEIAEYINEITHEQTHIFMKQNMKYNFKLIQSDIYVGNDHVYKITVYVHNINVFSESWCGDRTYLKIEKKESYDDY